MTNRGRGNDWTVAALAVALGGNAWAAGFQLQEQNASGLGIAYSGQAAAAEDASTVYWNPAGMTRLDGRQVVAGLELVRTSGKFRSGNSCLPYLGVGAGSTACPFGANGNLGHTGTGSGGDAGDWAGIPNLYGSLQLTPQLWLGIGVGVPFGLKTEWDIDWIGRFHATKSEVMTINVNPSIAWKPNEVFSIGAGVNAMRIEAELANAVSYRAAALATAIPAIILGTPAGAEGIATVEGDDWGWGWNLGAIVNLGPATRIGVHYRSTIKFTLDGNVRFDGRPAALGAVPQLADGNISAEVRLPDTFSIGFAHSFSPRWQLLADWTWTGWESIQDLNIVRADGLLSGRTLNTLALHLKDSWRAGLGLNYQISDPLKLRFGIAHDTSAVRDEFRSPRLPDEDRTWLAVGAQWKPSKQWAFDLGYAYLIVKDASSAVANQETATSAPRGSLVGEYEADTHLLGAQARYSF